MRSNEVEGGSDESDAAFPPSHSLPLPLHLHVRAARLALGVLSLVPRPDGPRNPGKPRGGGRQPQPLLSECRVRREAERQPCAPSAGPGACQGLEKKRRQGRGLKGVAREREKRKRGFGWGE